MNVITVLIDSLNFHSLEPYGATQVQTPNLQRFAQRAAVFDNHFISSAPCMPARRELFTGRQEFLWRGWGHVEPWDRHLAAEAHVSGAVTQMVTDHYHYWENGAHGYFEPFDGVEFVRGSENDMWQTAPVDDLPPWAESINQGRSEPRRNYPGSGSQFYANARAWETEADLPAAQVMRKSADWLDANHTHEKFLLWVESFDPHEPFYVPEPYRSLYTQGIDDPHFNLWPPYQKHEDAVRFVQQASDAEIEWIRAQYHGNVTLVDAWLGRLWDKLDELNLWETTAVIVTSDHGHDLCYNRLDNPTIWAKSFPHPESHARIPLMIWHPDYPGSGQRIPALTNTLDINATIRDLLDVPEPEGPHGRSLLPLLRGEASTHRDYLLYGTFGHGVVATDANWTLAQGSVADGPLYWYSTTAMRTQPDMTSGHFLPGVDVPQWRVPARAFPHPNTLWSREAFTLTPANRYAQEPGQVQHMQDLLWQGLTDSGAPPETWQRLGLAHL
jgi:arylsulfatase A-like enzyme